MLVIRAVMLSIDNEITVTVIYYIVIIHKIKRFYNLKTMIIIKQTCQGSRDLPHDPNQTIETR